MLYQFLPRLSDDEYGDLEASIREHGIQVPILVDDNRAVIDGHHRKEIAERLGVECPTRFAGDLTDEQKRTLALSLNLHRRHLTREQKRGLVEASIKADPHLSDRQHADRTGVDHKTVGSRRSELESTGEIPQSGTRTSADGRERPARNQTPAHAAGAASLGEQASKVAQAEEGDTAAAVESPTEDATATTPEAGTSTSPRPPVVGMDGKTYAAPIRPTERDLSEHIDAVPSVQDSRYLASLTKQLREVAAVHQFDPERVAALADDQTVQAIEAAFDNFRAWRQRITDKRSGLRVIKGGAR